jgi:hypothetical protein
VYLIKMLFTADHHGSAASTGPWRGPHRRAGRAKYLVKQFRVIGNHSAMPKPFDIERLYIQLGSCHGPAGGAPAAGPGGGGCRSSAIEQQALGACCVGSFQGHVIRIILAPRSTAGGI